MISALLLALSSPQAVLEITRGLELRPGYQYWAVEDATLDASMPDEPNGASLTLLGGPSRTIMIQFQDLERAVGAGKRIKSAKLVLTPLSEKPELRGVARVLKPWHEGPLRPLIPKASSSAPRYSVTWKSRRLGGAEWQSPGASGSADAKEIEGVKAISTESDYIVEGLGPAMEQMRQRWYENHGLALRFGNPVEFYSSQAQIGRPRLILELEDAPLQRGADLSVVLIEASGDSDRTYTAHVRNVGDQPSEGFSAAWVTDESAGASLVHPEPLAPGQEKTLNLTKSFKADDTDHRLQPLGLRITPTGEDAKASNDYLEIQQAGFPISLNVAKDAEDWAQSVVRLWNDVYSTQSRYSFAPSGSLERVRVARFVADGPAVETGNERALLRQIGLALGLADLSQQQIAPGSGVVDLNYGSIDPFPGIMGGGDTRYDGGVPGTIWLPYEPRVFEPFDVIPPDATGLLSATDVATLHANLGRVEGRTSFAGIPPSVLIRAQDITGRQLRGLELSFFPMSGGKIDLGAPAFTVATNETGIAVLPKPEGGLFGDLSKPGSGVLLARAQLNGVTSWAWLKAWQVADSFARGGGAVAIADLRFNVPGVPLEATTNLASNRIVSDSANSAPAKLAALVDGNPATAIDLPAGKDGWIEIDLGRDRTLGEIRLSAPSDALWSRFDVIAYGTGQQPNAVAPLFQERNWAWTASNRSESQGPVREVAYRLPGGRYRFIRFVNKGGASGKLNEVRVVPAKVESN